MRHLIQTSLAVLFFSSALLQSGLAENLSTEQIIQQLRPSSKTRSIKPNRGINVEEMVVEDQNPTINLYINFEYNSAELKQDAVITLDNLAAALKDERLTSFEFLIGGHTDAIGSEAFNLNLSEQRAWAVKRYLVSRRSVSPARLIEKGFGEARLLNPDKPLDGINRRVQITTLTIPTQ